VLDVELNAGQMVEDVRLGVNGKVPVEFYGRMGGVIPSAEEVVDALKRLVQRTEIPSRVEVTNNETE
jgi:2-oxoglutarate ferredoxin oxidoreductase subunit alpha